MPRHLRALFVPVRLVTKDDAAHQRLIDDAAAATVDQPAPMNTGVMIAGHPSPVDRCGQRAEHVLRCHGQAVASVPVVETVAKAPNLARLGDDHERGQVGECGHAVIGGQHLAEFGKPAALFEVQVRDQQRAAVGPPQCTAA